MLSHLNLEPATLLPRPSASILQQQSVFVIVDSMYDKIRRINRNSLVSIGFTLLLIGIALATFFDDILLLRIIGLVLIVASSAVFGASINATAHHKK